MNKIYKVVWNAARGCYVVGSEFIASHRKTKSETKRKSILSQAGRAFLIGLVVWGTSYTFSYAAVTVADPKHADTVTAKNLPQNGTQYDITNQQTNGNNALNKFNDFGIAKNDVANLHLGTADHQINLVKNKIDIDGVVNAIKNNKIGGDVYFFSNAGIAVGANGVFNVGRLTLGTNTQAGQALYDGYRYEPSQTGQVKISFDRDKVFYGKSPVERARLLNSGDLWGGNTAGNAGISVAGKIHAQDSVVLASAKSDMSTASGSVIQTGAAFNAYTKDQAADAYRNTFINTAGIQDATTAVATSDGIALVAKKDIRLAGDIASHGRSVIAETGDNLSITGTAEKASRIMSGGGAIMLTASSGDAKLQAKPSEKPHDGMISITDAYIDSSSEKQNSGTIDITAVRNVMGVSRIDVDDSTITAEGKSGHQAGNVSIHVTAETKLYAWDIGDGAYALIQMGQNSRGRNVIKGDNVDISARASTSGVIGDDNVLSDAELQAGIEREKDRDPILGLLEEYGGNFRTFGSATKTYAEANVDIDKTDITAVGNGTSEAGHGDVKITSDAQSDIAPFNLNLFSFGFNVGIGDVKSYVYVDDSTLSAAKNISFQAEGTNTINMSDMDFNVVDPLWSSSLDFSWAKLTSDIKAKVGKDATLISQGDVDLGAKSIRTLKSGVSNCGNTLAAAIGIGISDTKAAAEMAGTVYAGGDVSVKAENTLAESGGVYAADTVTAASIGGDSAMKPTTDPLFESIENGAKKVAEKVKKFLAGEDKTGQIAKDLDLDAPDENPKPANKKKPWNKLGFNASTALLFSENDAIASVTGKVRGIDADGKSSDTVGAKSLTVDALTLSRSHAVVNAFQNDTTISKNETTKKNNTMTAAISYLEQRNHATAFISGDTKTIGDTTVHAKTKIPWQTSWQSTEPVDQLMNLFFNTISTNPVLPDLVDSWSQAAGNGDNVNGAASVSIVNYDNNAKAYIGKKDLADAAPSVDAGGNVNVLGETDITTVNLTGTIQSYLSSAPLNLWKLGYEKDKMVFQDIFNRNGWTMEGASKAGVGGAALSVYQKNHAEAYIDDGAVVTAKESVDVDAKARALNIAMAAAGGPAKSVAVDATVGVNRFDNTTKARIGDATVTAKNVNVAAEDLSKTIQTAGAIGISGGSGIGASIAYNHINRNTEAAIQGNVTAENNVDVSAKNTGEIIAASIAGAVAYDNKKPNVKNNAGSTGFHAVEEGDADGIELEDLAGDMDYRRNQQDADENVPLLSHDADEHIEAVAGKDGAMADNVAEAKGSLAAAANVSVNRITDTAKAYVAKKDSRPVPSITADALRVQGENDSAIKAISAAISLNLKTENLGAGKSLAGSFMYNSITADNEAYVDGASLTLRGNNEKDKDGKNIDESLTVHAENNEQILNIAASGTYAQGFSGAGQVSLNWVDDKTDAHVKDSTVKADEAIAIDAKDKGQIDSYTGAVSISTHSSAVGAAIGVNLIEGDTKSYLENSEVSGMAENSKSGQLAVAADEASRITSILASGTLANDAATSFSASGNWIHTKTDAHVASDKTMKTGPLTIDAGNHSNATLGVGVAALSDMSVGASVAVMVNDSDVMASLKGHDKKEKTIEADGISVTADNAYNGSAKDSESDSTAKTVAVGATLGAAKFAGSGSVTVNVISQKADAVIGKGLYEAGNQGVTVQAKNKANLFGMAGGLALSGATGIGAAADVQTYQGHTYASIEDGAKLSHASAVAVLAESEENLTSVAATLAGSWDFSGAGAAGLHVISADTKAYIGNQADTDITDADKAELTDAGTVSVAAKDTTKLVTAGGAGTAGSTAGAGLTAAVEVVNKKTNAYVGNHAKVDSTSLAVEAKNISDSTTAAAGLGAGGTAGVAGAAAETFVMHQTDAHIGKGAKVTTAGNTDVKAISSFKQGAGAGSLGTGETAGIGLANSTVSLNADTAAHIDNGASVTGKTVRIAADHTTDITYATIAGGIAGTAAINGSVGVNVLDTKTKAYTGDYVALTATGTGDEDGISLAAKDMTKLHGGNGGAAVGFTGGGGGLALAVTNIQKDTEAYAGKAAKLDAKGRIALDAQNTEDLFNLSLQAAGGSYAGLAGAANVVNLTSLTKAYTNTGAEINQKEGYGKDVSKDVSVTATHEVKEMKNTVTAASGSGGASVGAAVDIANVKTGTNAFLGDGNKVSTKGNVHVTATDNMHDMESNAISAAIGSFGLSGSISVYSVGSAMSQKDQETLSGKTSANGETVGFDSWVNDELAKINKDTSKAVGAYSTDSLLEVKNKLGMTFASEAPDTTGEKGTLAKIGNGTAITAGGDVTVKADDKLSMQNVMGSLSGSAMASVGASVSTVNTDTQTKALVDQAASITAGKDLAVQAASMHNLHEYIIGASFSGGVAGQGTVATWNDKSDVSALLGDTNTVHAGNISIISDNDRTLDSYVVGASAALYGALNGSVITANVTGSSEAGIGDDKGIYAGEVKADDTLMIASSAKTKMDATAIGAAAGIFGGTGTGADLKSAVDVQTKVGKNAKLSGKSISLTADNTPDIQTLATSAGIGIGGVGVTVAEVESKDTARVKVEDGAILTAADKLTAKAAMNQPADTGRYNAYAHAIAGSGGVVNGSVAVVGVNLENTTETTIGRNVTIQAGRAEITSKHSDAGNLAVESIGAGSYSGTGADTRYTVNSTSNVTIGDGTSITTAKDTAIRADNVSEKAWRDGSEKQNATSGGAAFASGNGVVSITKINHTTTADIGKATIQASASDLTEEETAAGKTIHDKKAIAVDARSTVKARDNNVLTTGSAVGAAHVKAAQDVTADTSVAVADGAVLKAGETEKANAAGKSWTASQEGDAYDGSYKGGSIAVGSRNDADLYSTTTVDVFGAAGYAGSENNVTYTGKAKTTFGGTAETAKGDISLAAGRDSTGETGSISVSAHSDILNATAIPISVQKDPLAKADSQANLTIAKAADLKSDRDVLLKAKAGAVSAYGTGEVKDWVNAAAEAFGSDGSQIGKKEIAKSADVSMDGNAETGIHRKKSLTIGGSDKNGNWTTTVKSDGDLSYTYGAAKPAGTALYDRLHELQEKLTEYAADPAAKAAYEAEIQFLEEKMAAQGLGYFEKDSAGHTRFVEMPPETTSELEDAKNVLAEATENWSAVMSSYNDSIQKTQAQIDELTKITNSKTAYDSAVTQVDLAQTALDNAKATENTAKSAVESLAAKAGQSVDEYIKSHQTEDAVTKYQTAQEQSKTAAAAKATADSEKKKAEATYAAAVKSYNASYNDSISANPTAYDAVAVAAKQSELTEEKSQQKTEKDGITKNYNDLQRQIELTEAFFDSAKGNGTETEGKFYDAHGNEVIDGKITVDGKEYYLLHSQTYQQMTHDFIVGDITAQLGDIVFEGDNVFGAGTLRAGGDAEVKITNDSPNNLVTGDIHVIGSKGTDGAGQGGTIYFNSTEIKGDKAEDILAGIRKGNTDKTKSVSFTAETRYQTGGPNVTIENNFRPQAYVDEGNAPLYAAPSVQLKGYIYNPRGTVTVTSANGDVYNSGSIYAGSVNMTATNGDFIQSYNPSLRISSVGGNPLDDSGNLYNVDANGNANDKLGTGILANGNIFISARYVNINSKIQSGVADHAITIPKDYQLFYMDGSTKIQVTDVSKVPSGTKILVADKTGREIENISYDRNNDRFVISDVEVKGGHVSIVGTILNTTNDTSKARIEALDGYGTIQVKNDSDKDIELRTLSTGAGIEGQIEITDLDRTSGEIKRKTTYTRKDGTIQQSIQKYEKGKPKGTPVISTYTNTHDAKYETEKGAYYTVQTGTDKSTTTTYEIHETKVDWWGISDKAPTEQDMIDRGGILTDFKQGTPTTLHGGAFVSDYNQIGGGRTDGTYQVSDKTFTTDEQSTFTKESTRLWYTLWMAKKFDYKLVTTKYETDVNQYSLKADYDIGIGFSGSENGGTLTVAGGNRDVLINGTLSNGRGTASLAGANLIQGDLGYVDTGSLTMTAAKNAGSAGNAIRTNADYVTGRADGDFAVHVREHGVTLGDVTAGNIAAITAENGISQKAATTLAGSRVNLDAGSGAITGASGALAIRTGQGSGEAYGLKAVADGNITITNQGGDLYLDSVTSKQGNVALTTDGSFIDNNFGDVTNESAKEKLEAWAKAAVLEGSKETIQKQKSLLVAKIQSKYNEYQSLAAYVKDGTYTLDEGAKEALVQQGITDIDAYIQEKQTRYDELKQSVGNWTKADVEAYVQSINNSTDGTLYGNAALQAADLTSDRYLTAAEKAEALVGSAKSAQDLLVTFSGGGIKEGITDTQTTQKETPHVTGNNVTLTALGGKKENGKYTSGIGHKENSKVIDLSAENIDKLSADELLALAAAERSDFKVNGNTVTVSSVHAIEANASGVLTANAENGALYLSTKDAVNTGSTLTSGGELRLKGTGDLTGITVGSDDQIVLESGEGKISNVNITGKGVLTARAKNGVQLSKQDGDLIINTIYAADGDVTMNLGGHSLLAADGHDESGEEMGTTYLNVEGKNISIENVNHITGVDNGKSIGMKVTGTKTEDGSKTPGILTAQAAGNADITLFGEAASDNISIEAENTSITSRGHITNGSYTARKALRVHTAKGSSITGGTFSGASADITNTGTISGGDYSAKTGGLSVTNEGKLTDGTYTAKADTLTITNHGTIEQGSYTAHGDFTYTDSVDASVSDSTFISESGKATVTAHGNLTLTELSAKHNAAITADGNAALNKITAGSLHAKSITGSVTAGTLTTTTGDANVTAKNDVTIDTLNAENGNAEIEATEGTLNVTTLQVKDHAKLTSGKAMTLETANAGSINANAGTTLTVKKLVSTDKADFTSNGDTKLENVSAGTLKAVSTAGSVTAEMLTATAGDANVTAKNDVTIGTLNAENGSTAIEATEGALNVTTLQVKDHAKLTSGKAMTLGTANASSVTAKAGTTLQVKQKLQAADKADLTSGSDMILEEAQADSVLVNAGGKLIAKTLGVAGSADLTSRDAMELLDATVGSVTAKAGTTLQVKKLVAHDKTDFMSADNMTLHDVEVGGSLTANAGESILADGASTRISAGDIQMTAGEEIRMTDRAPVGKLSGVDTSISPGTTTGSGSAGSLVTGEAKPHDFDVSKKGHVQLLSTSGKVSLSAKNVEIDTLANGNGLSAELAVSANHIGIDDLTSGASKQYVTIHGSDGRSQARYAGIHSTANGGTLIKDSAVEHLNVTGIEPIGLTNTAIGGDSILATEKICVTITKNPKSSLAEYFGTLYLNGSNITTDHLMTSIRDGLTVNGERFPMTAENSMNTSLYGNRLLGSDGKKKEEKESRTSDGNLTFAGPADNESFTPMK